MTPEELKELRAARKALMKAWEAPGYLDIHIVGLANQKLRTLIEPYMVQVIRGIRQDPSKSPQELLELARLRAERSRINGIRTQARIAIERRLKRLHGKNKVSSRSGKAGSVLTDAYPGGSLQPQPCPTSVV